MVSLFNMYLYMKLVSLYYIINKLLVMKEEEDEWEQK